MTVYFSFGSNKGERQSNIQKALEGLKNALGAPPRAVSEIIETKSWGFEGPDFLNCAASFETDYSPEKILSVCKEIERSLGRTDSPEYTPDGRRIYHSRTIDIDILFYGTQMVKTKDLTIPHPLIKERDFVKIPLSQIVGQDIKDAFPEIFINLQD